MMLALSQNDTYMEMGLDSPQGRQIMRAMTTQSDAHNKIPLLQSHLLTHHAQKRMTARSLSHDAVAAALTFGRSVHTRGAKIHVIGRKEVEHYRQQGIDLSPFEGVHLICSPDGTIITIYRNRDFRSLRPHRRSRRRDGKWNRMLYHAA
jgi:hypothetical protein